MKNEIWLGKPAVFYLLKFFLSHSLNLFKGVILQDNKQKQSGTADHPQNQNRRKVIKKMAVGIGALAGCAVVPEKWIRPIVGQVVLPAHAETSGVAEASVTEIAATGDYNTSEVYTLRTLSGNNKRFTWLNQTGASYGGPVKFVFSDNCGELHVPDAAVTFGADGDSSNYNQAFYFCGTDFPAGSKENNGGKASVFGPPGCPAATVTMYYNK